MLCSILFACNSPTPLELSWEGCAVRLWFLCHPGLWLLSGMGHGSSCWLRSARLIISLILPWPGGGRRRRGIPRKSGCLLSALGSWLPGQLLSPWGGPESSGPVLEPGMAGGGTCREASEGGQREMPRTPSWVAVIPRLIWGPWIFPMRKGNWSWRVGPLRALVDFETQHLVMFFSYDL